MKRFFALLLSAAMLSALAVPVSAAEATYKVADVSQVAYIEDDDGRLDLSGSVSRVPYGETMYFPLLNGGASGIDDAYTAYAAADKAYGTAQEATKKAKTAQEQKQTAYNTAKAAYEAANGDTTALQKAVTDAQNKVTEAEAAKAKADGELTAAKTEQTNAAAALTDAKAKQTANAVPQATLDSLKSAQDTAKGQFDTASAELTRLEGLVTSAKAAYDAYPETDTGEAKKMAYDAWQKAIGDRDTYKNGTYASKESAYTTAQKAYADAQKANSDLAQAVTNAQSRKDKADTAVSSKQQAVTTAADNVTKAKEALKKAQDNLNNAASATEAKAKMDAAQKELEAAKKTYTDAQTAESAAKTKMETAKKAYDDLKNNRYRYVYESSAAGDASAKASWEENSGRYLGNPTIKKIRVADAPTGATSSAMSYIYCVAIKVNDRSSTDSRDVFGEITVKQTRGDRENRFENVVLDLAIEIGYKSSSDTDVVEGVIPEKAAIFKKGDGFEQDSEFIFEFEADPDSSFVVNTVGQGSITLGMTTDPDEDLYDDILDEYPDAYVDFFNGNYATFNRTGTLYLAPSDGEDNYYVYSIDERGNVARVSAEWDSSEDAYAIKTRTLGRYFLSSERLSNSFLSSINGTSPSRPSSGSGSSSSSTGSGDLVVVPAPTIPSSPSSTPTYNPPSSSSQASSSSSSQSSSSSSSEEASEPEEESSAPEEDPSSEPEEVVDVDTNADDTDGPKKGGSALVWVLIIVGLLAAGGAVGFVLYQNKVKRQDDGYSQYDEYDDDNDFPDDDDRH